MELTTRDDHNAVSALRIGAAAQSRSRTAHEFVREVLRRAILNGSLAGGTRLFQNTVAHELDVSTTPVREAFRDLANEGLITIDAHRGASVRNIDADRLRDIYDVRMLLEPEAARRLIGEISKERLVTAEGLLDQMVNTEDAVQWAQLNHVFHQVLTEGGRSRQLVATIRGLQDSAAAYVITALQDQGALREHNEQHRRILDAFRQQDGDKAAEATTHHLVDTLRRLLRLADSLDRRDVLTPATPPEPASDQQASPDGGVR